MAKHRAHAGKALEAPACFLASLAKGSLLLLLVMMEPQHLLRMETTIAYRKYGFPTARHSVLRARKLAGLGVGWESCTNPTVLPSMVIFSS